MTLNEMKDFLTYVWYLFLACLLIYMIIAIGYSLIKQVKKERNSQELIDKFIEETLKNNKK